MKILSNDGEGGDHFGNAVAISGTTAVIGAILDDDNGVDSGSAYIFDIMIGQQLFKLLPADGAPDEQVGSSVAISGDVAIVGAYRDDDNGEHSGSAYLFDATTGEQVTKLLPSDGGYYHRFGTSVAISGDTAIVGAPGWTGYGTAYVFRRDGAEWTEEGKLIPTDGDPDDEFGYAVAISGTTAIVGAPLDYVGSAYIFDTTTSDQLFKLVPDDAAGGARFGHSVAISGTTAIVGGHLDGGSAWHGGAAWVFDTLTGEQIGPKLLASDGGESHQDVYFGCSVSISGMTALVGAYQAPDTYYSYGQAYAFRFDGADWVEEAKLVTSDRERLDEFGISVAISGATAIGGAWGDDGNGATSAGSAYIFHGLGDYDENGIIDICDINFDGPVDIESIGEPTDVVSIDFTGDGANDIAVAELGPVPSEPGYIVLLLNDGSGLNFEKQLTGVGLEPTAFTVADFDGTNGPDAAVTNSADNDVRILLNDGEGNGTFEPPDLDVPVGNFPSDVAAGDFNGDTFIDLAVTNRDDNNVMILTNNGTGAFTVTSTFDVGTAPSAIIAADFDGDELIDLAVANEADNNVMIFLNTGARGFQHHATIEVDLGPGVLEPEDLDDDQHIDMAVGNRGSDKITLLINDGAANFETMTLTVGDDPASIAIADVELDGDEDILVVADTLDSRAVRVLRNDLNGGEELGFTLFTDLAEDPNLKLTAAKDLDGNSLPDVIAVNGPAEGGPRSAGKGEEGSVRVLLNGLVICPGDLDGDWDVDTGDLLQLLGCWGTDCGDVDFDGDTDSADLLALLGAWGECP
jgi:hypothetical protein